jgi:transcriptional regulator with XRE-family HTH domain
LTHVSLASGCQSEGRGVIDMDLLSVIRRWHFRQKISIREIKRRTGLSRNTIRKYLRSDAIEPSFKVPIRPSKLDPFAEKLTAWLRVESKKSRKQRRTAKQLHADLLKLDTMALITGLPLLPDDGGPSCSMSSRPAGVGHSCP